MRQSVTSPTHNEIETGAPLQPGTWNESRNEGWTSTLWNGMLILRQMTRGRSSLAFGLAIVVGIAGCGHRPESGNTPAPPLTVETLTVHLQRTPEIFEVVGTVRPRVSATISAKVLAMIEEVAVKAGDVVTNGQLLARLDARELAAEFDRARADYERIKTLVEQQAAAAAELDAVYARYRVAQAALSNTRIVAPFDGVIASKLCDVGDMAAPNKPLFVIEQTDRYRLEAFVPERYAAAGAVGKHVHVIPEATGEKCLGVIGESEPTADTASRSFLIKIDLDCRQPVKSGGFGRAQLIVGERFALFVPRDAIHHHGQLTYVFVAENNRAAMRLVKLGQEYLGAVEILSGVNPDERVIVKADGTLRDGVPIKLP